jgi:hypothetical protein
MKKLILLVALAALCFTGSVWAQSDVMDTIGYLYETDNDPLVDGFPPSNPGDVLAGLGFIDNISAPLTWSQTDYEYTFVISDLVSMGQITLPDGRLRIDYTGGTIDIVAQAYADGAYSMPFYGINPPDGAAIASFNDGEIYLHGTFDAFTMIYDPVNFVGNYQGLLTFVLGSHFTELGQELQNPSALTIAGVVGDAADQTVPEGYDLETDGHIYYDGTIPVNDTMTWGSVKSLF